MLNQWTCCYADGNDQPPYYVNEYTRKLSWEKPLDYIEPTIEPVAKQKIENKKQLVVKKQKNGGKNKQTQQQQPAMQKKKYPFDEDPVDEYEIEFFG